MRIIRRGTFETNSSSTHSITLVYLKNQDSKINSYRGKTLVYKEFGYDFAITEGSVDDVESKLNTVCDFLVSRKREVFPKNLDEFINYLKETYDITVEINSKYPLEGRDNGIRSLESCGEDPENYDLDNYSRVSIRDKRLSEMSAEELTNFIFNDGNCLYIDSDYNGWFLFQYDL